MERIFQCSREKCCETAFKPVFEENDAKRIDHSNAFTWKNVVKRNSFLFLGKRHGKPMLYESVSHHFTFTELYFKSFDRYRWFTI